MGVPRQPAGVPLESLVPRESLGSLDLFPRESRGSPTGFPWESRGSPAGVSSPAEVPRESRRMVDKQINK